MKKKIFGLALIVMLSFALALPSAYAASSSKSAVKAGEIAYVTGDGSLALADADGYQTIMTQSIKTPEKKDLVVGVSLEVGLYTDTKVWSKKLLNAYADAWAQVKVKVVMDGQEVAMPGEVIFAERQQRLVAEFAGDIRNALSIVDGVLQIDESLIDPEMLQLVLNTMAAHSFNFIIPDVHSGVHTIEVMAKVETTQDGTPLDDDVQGIALSDATLGKGSLTVDCVRFVNKDAQIEL